jgi:hypothetical protein
MNSKAAVLFRTRSSRSCRSRTIRTRSSSAFRSASAAIRSTSSRRALARRCAASTSSISSLRRSAIASARRSWLSSSSRRASRRTSSSCCSPARSSCASRGRRTSVTAAVSSPRRGRPIGSAHTTGTPTSNAISRSCCFVRTGSSGDVGTSSLSRIRRSALDAGRLDLSTRLVAGAGLRWRDRSARRLWVESVRSRF